MDSTEPSGASARAGGAPKFDVPATSTRFASRMRPGCVKAANSALSRIGPPGWNVPTGETAPAPGMPTATTRAVRECVAPGADCADADGHVGTTQSNKIQNWSRLVIIASTDATILITSARAVVSASVARPAAGASTGSFSISLAWKPPVCRSNDEPQQVLRLAPSGP